MKVLSVRQPWAWLIVNGFKDIENRTWSTRFRGPLLIHAGKSMTKQEHEDVCAFLANDPALRRLNNVLPLPGELERGGIVGMAAIADCVDGSSSPWFMGEFGFVMRNAKPLTFTPMRGMLGFFDTPAGYKVPT